jgi:hypothetical protein
MANEQWSRKWHASPGGDSQARQPQDVRVAVERK